ncbi:HAD family hydrolase [Vibrio nigripulchritudo]|uniref:HAD family hydrolase n=1 Tax=Vibrio nigripulchritudo TaxID=28173 RepID=UPI0003B19774|nr:HAD family phosphatase [Vibrio nigripulchritudo]CCN68696.1 putative 2-DEOXYGLUCOSE-6-PHOSPHATE PHOSPHATASE 2 [Vibrio nigripulchritudo SFn118]
MRDIDKSTLKFEGVLWDMDGTIADSEPIHERAIRTTLNKQGVNPTHEDLLNVLGTEGIKTFEYFRDKYDLSVSFDDYRNANYQYFCQHSDEITPLYGCDLFRAFRKAGVPQAVVTNSDRILVNAALAALEIEIPGMIVVARNDVRNGKPSPEGYLRAAYLLDIEPEKLAVIEDSPLGAKAGMLAGMEVIGVPLPELRDRFPSELPVALNGDELLKALSKG